MNLKENFEKLKLYVPIVDRVHGKQHPEFNEVHRLFNELMEKIDSKDSLEEIFVSLRQVTSNYLVPDDTCESYEAVYVMLSELDQHFSG